MLKKEKKSSRSRSRVVGVGLTVTTAEFAETFIVPRFRPRRSLETLSRILGN